MGIGSVGVMRVIVCGGRNYDDYDFLCKIMNDAHRQVGIECVIQGLAKGADLLAKRWAHERGVECIGVKADWDRHGRAAGPLRNGEMLKYSPDFCFAFPGGAGTENMMRQAIAAGIKTSKFDPATEWPNTLRFWPRE